MTAYSQNLFATKQLIELAIKKQEKEWDSVFLICGEEGKGKSTYLLHLINIVDEIKGKQTHITAVTRTLRELIFQLNYTKNKEQLALDEGSELSSDLSYEGIVKAIRKVFTVMRQKSLLVYICFTNPVKINTYFKHDRVKGVFLITERGKVNFYTRQTFMRIQERIVKYKSGVRSIKNVTELGVPPDFIDTYPKYKGRLWEEYQARKEENINEIIEDLYEEFGVDEKRITLNKARKILHIRDATIKEYLRFSEEDTNPKHILKATYSANKSRIFLKENDVWEFKTWLEAQSGTTGESETPHSVLNETKTKTETKEQKEAEPEPK